MCVVCLPRSPVSALSPNWEAAGISTRTRTGHGGAVEVTRACTSPYLHLADLLPDPSDCTPVPRLHSPIFRPAFGPALIPHPVLNQALFKPAPEPLESDAGSVEH